METADAGPQHGDPLGQGIAGSGSKLQVGPSIKEHRKH